jgi:hypothetical protein
MIARTKSLNKRHGMRKALQDCINITSVSFIKKRSTLQNQHQKTKQKFNITKDKHQ